MKFLILVLSMSALHAQLPYLLKDTNANEVVEYLQNEINRRGTDASGCIYAPALCVNPATFRVGVSTDIPAALLHISTVSSTGPPLFIASTGTTKLFEITGNSVTVNLPMFIGANSSNNLVIQSSSVTLISPATVYAPAGSLLLYSPDSETGKCTWSDAFDPIFIITSGVPTAEISPDAFLTVDISTHIAAMGTQGNPAKMAFIKARCRINSDGTEDANVCSYMVPTDSGITEASSNNEVCCAEEQNGVTILDHNTVPIKLDSSERFNLKNQVAGTSLTRNVSYYLMGVCH